MSTACLQEGEGIVPEVNPLALLPVLADFLQLKDPGMLTLEVSGLTSKYPDIRLCGHFYHRKSKRSFRHEQLNWSSSLPPSVKSTCLYFWISVVTCPGTWEALFWTCWSRAPPLCPWDIDPSSQTFWCLLPPWSSVCLKPSVHDTK